MTVRYGCQTHRRADDGTSEESLQATQSTNSLSLGMSAPFIDLFNNMRPE